LAVRPYFLRVVAGCCKWRLHVITLIIEKNIQKKIISDLPTLIFSQYETGTTGIFFTPCGMLN
jgi:hypothetical protein